MKACQDLSTAGMRRGLRPGTRSGLWEHMAYAIDQLRPQLVVIENVRGLLSATAHCDVEPCPLCVGDGSDSPLRALGAVLGDLAELGYDARWGGVRASDAGAPHRRERVFIVAYPAGVGWERPWGAWDGRAGFADGGVAAAHASGDGRKQRGAEPARVQGGPDAAVGSRATAADAGGERHGRREDTRSVGRMDGDDAGQARQRQRARQVAGDRSGTVDFGPYAAAVRRWEHATGVPAPSPTEPGRNGPRLSPDFTEWMMGWPVGWTDVGIPRAQRLKICGNGVVPQQAALALRLLAAG